MRRRGWRWAVMMMGGGNGGSGDDGGRWMVVVAVVVVGGDDASRWWWWLMVIVVVVAAGSNTCLKSCSVRPVFPSWIYLSWFHVNRTKMSSQWSIMLIPCRTVEYLHKSWWICTIFSFFSHSRLFTFCWIMVGYEFVCERWFFVNHLPHFLGDVVLLLWLHHLSSTANYCVNG